MSAVFWTFVGTFGQKSGRPSCTADTCEVSQPCSQERPVCWPFGVELDPTAGTLAVCGGAGSSGRYVGRLQWSQIRRPLRWPFVVQPDPAADTLAVFG